MKIELKREVGLSALHKELNEALDIPIALSRRDGVLTILGAETGEPVPVGSVDSVVVWRTIDAHVYVDPEEQPSADEQLVEALETAETVNDLKSALLGRHRPVAERARESRLRRRSRQSKSGL